MINLDLVEMVDTTNYHSVATHISDAIITFTCKTVFDFALFKYFLEFLF
jgi:hypothetical protein